MDLNYTDKAGRNVGVMPDHEMDMAFGDDENDFECTVSLIDHCCESGCMIFYEDADAYGKIVHTEYGGIINKLRVDTANNSVTYCGRTWHGILESKVICPDAGEDYLVLSGEANEVLLQLIERMELSEVFTASADSSGIQINNYKMDRYIKGYSGIRKMLRSVDAKPVLRYRDGSVQISALPLVDYSKDEEWDTGQMDFTVEKNDLPTNHMICLGKGDLKDREVIHLYTDASGIVSTAQTFTGADEVTDIYDYPNAESSDELVKGGTEKLKEAYDGADAIGVNFESNENYDIGDIVGAREEVTGVFVSREIVKKIITENKNGMNIECQIGE